MTPPALSGMQSFTCPHCRWATFNPIDIQYGYCAHCKVCLAESRTTPESFPPIWVIYDHPWDYPDNFVVRVAWGPWQERRLRLVDTLALARTACHEEGAGQCLPRYPNDDPVIAECWI